jgi:hypothetical protein
MHAGDVETVWSGTPLARVADEGYSVEFFDMTGNTAAVVTLPASVLRMRGHRGPRLGQVSRDDRSVLLRDILPDVPSQDI